MGYASRERALEYSRAYHSTNREKERAYAVENRDRIRRNKLKRDFGMTPEDYGRLLEEQQGVCAVCGLPEISVRRGKLVPLCVDHDHQTGKVRGLLCSKCNAALGMLKESIDIAASLISYMKNNQGA
jgi:hypothetical protein